MNTTKVNSEADIWLRTMLPETGRISPQDAETILKLRLSPGDRARADALGQKANAGTTFEQLSDQYTMDGNNTHGDTDWFSGQYSFAQEFQDAVQNHKRGEIFFVDVPEKQWHYIVKKTYDDRVKKDIIVLRANGR